MICWIVGLCLLGLIILLCWLFEFIFKKLNLNAISDFFGFIKLLLVITLIFGGLIIGVVLVLVGSYFVVTHITDFIFALF